MNAVADVPTKAEGGSPLERPGYNSKLQSRLLIKVMKWIVR